MDRTCGHCGQPMPIMARSHAKACSPRCRKALYRASKKDTLPAELTCRARWVRRSATKVPLTTAGRAASSTDPRTWSSYKEASKSRAGVGLGFVLNGDGIVCLDLDHAIAIDGSLKPWAADIVRTAGATYAEISPSGDGLHIFGYADVRHGRRIRRSGGYAVEIYGTGRYLAMTGDRFRDAPSALADISVLVDKLT